MKKYVLISIYFGKLPDYFHLWLKSAEKNRDIDFLMITDADLTKFNPLPNNVKTFCISFIELKKLIQTKFDFKINLEKPYKLCDYRPAFGYIFQDYICGYKYWGHIDLDTVLGNLSKYFPQEEYEKIYLYGHLCIYKNTAENNVRFMQNAGMDYKKVFTTNFNMIFDERPGMYKKYKLLNIPQYESNDFADIARRRANFTLNNEICKHNYKYQIFYYENGGVFRDYYSNGAMHTDEFNYIHFSHRKMPDLTNGASSFYITRYGFIEKNGQTSMDTIKQLNAPTPFKNVFCWLNTQIIRRIIRYSKLLISKLKN